MIDRFEVGDVNLLGVQHGLESVDSVIWQRFCSSEDPGDFVAKELVGQVGA